MTTSSSSRSPIKAQENKVELLGTYGGDLTHARKCSKCKEVKTVADFYRDRSGPDGLRSSCKKCANKAAKKWLASNQNKAKQTRLTYSSREDVKLRRCEVAKAWNRISIESTLLSKAKKRSKANNLPFNLTKDDILVPEICPALGIPLKVNDGKLGDGSPTLDRLIPELGYVVGNVCVISAKANRIKNNSSFEEMRKIAAWMAEREQNGKHR